MTDLVPVKRALLSVSDKTNLVEFAKELDAHGVELISTGGTAKAMQDAGLNVKEISEVTGFKEMMDGRVKTLHPVVHGGLLAKRDDAAHMASLQEIGGAPIDLVVINLYPFENTVASGADYDTCIENIDIGGPAMVRSAAKNHASVAIVTSPNQYDAVVTAMKAGNGTTNLELRQELARMAYTHTAAYDAAISNWFNLQQGVTFPETLVMTAKNGKELRYGENPHQKAAVYLSGESGLANAEQLQGKELSYNNLNDASAAFALVKEFDVPACAIIKHANPCGVAVGDNAKDAYLRALACDSKSAFGGIVALNRTLDADLAQELTQLFLEVVMAPEVTAEAREVLATKKNLRVLLMAEDAGVPEWQKRTISGGLLVQNTDMARLTKDDLKIVTNTKPSDEELDSLLFAAKVVKHVKSNAIVMVKDGRTVGIGAGQMSRVDSTIMARTKADEMTSANGFEQSLAEGSVAASDAFFPFPDAVENLAKAGAKLIIQPGGSMNDDAVIEEANKHGIAMVFTGVRHFLH